MIKFIGFSFKTETHDRNDGTTCIQVTKIDFENIIGSYAEESKGFLATIYNTYHFQKTWKEICKMKLNEDH